MKKLWRRIFKSKEMREYNKMYRKHRKTMIKLAKEDRDWDYGFLHDLVVTKIKHMHEYYTSGNNMLQSEETLSEILETLQCAIDLADKIDNANMRDQEELYKEFYSYVGEKIMWWWD